jgi:starch-binding outer membrane protein, SusD/RagB family
MTKMKKLIKIFILFTALASLGSGCKKFVDVGQPKNQLISSEVFADSTDANSALAGIYYSAITNTLGLNSGGMTLYPGLSSDELVPTGTSSSVVQFYANNILTNNNLNNGLWVGGYSFIYAANAIIEGVTKSNGISASAKTRLIAEARFVRGYEYFCLLNLYGPVPLVSSTDYKTTALLPRAEMDEVYASVIADLGFAEANLGTNTGSNDRPSSLTASAMLAKVYLYMSKNDLALGEASKVINSGNYALEPDPNSVFLSGSTEAIWQLDLPFNKYTWEGQTFVPNSSHGVPRYVLNPALYGSFESGDLRLTDWVKINKSAQEATAIPINIKTMHLLPWAQKPTF